MAKKQAESRVIAGAKRGIACNMLKRLLELGGFVSVLDTMIG